MVHIQIERFFRMHEETYNCLSATCFTDKKSLIYFYPDQKFLSDIFLEVTYNASKKEMEVHSFTQNAWVGYVIFRFENRNNCLPTSYIEFLKFVNSYVEDTLYGK